MHGQAVAIFRTDDDQVYALGNHDPYRARLGAGPRHRRASATTCRSWPRSPTGTRSTCAPGRCLDDDHVSVPAYDVKVVEGVVLVGHRKAVAA